MKPLIEAKNLSVSFKSGRELRYVLNNVDLTIQKGEIYGLVGGSGSGKSTLGRALLCLPKPNSGTINFAGHELTALSPKELIPLRQRMQIIFQDPYSALNPQMTVSALIGEGLEIHKIAEGVQLEKTVENLLTLVGLPPEGYRGRYPSSLSGGQRQRVCIARALAVNPEFIVCDEPLSALDVTMQVEIMELLRHLQRELGLSLLFISHNMPLIKKVCDRIGVMESGKVTELHR